MERKAEWHFACVFKIATTEVRRLRPLLRMGMRLRLLATEV